MNSFIEETAVLWKEELFCLWYQCHSFESPAERRATTTGLFFYMIDYSGTYFLFNLSTIYYIIPKKSDKSQAPEAKSVNLQISLPLPLPLTCSLLNRLSFCLFSLIHVGVYVPHVCLQALRCLRRSRQAPWWRCRETKWLGSSGSSLRRNSSSRTLSSTCTGKDTWGYCRSTFFSCCHARVESAGRSVTTIPWFCSLMQIILPKICILLSNCCF